MRETGFPAGYFSDAELDSAKLREDRRLKKSFLDSLIKLAETGSGEELRECSGCVSASSSLADWHAFSDATSSEIIAGLGALHTNTLLVTFGRLATNSALDRDALIRHCLSGLPVDDFVKNDGKKEEKNASKEQESRCILTNVDGDEKGREFLALALSNCNGDLDQTKDRLTNLVVKPKPSDKLLGRPPFRFIHDLLLAISQSTGFDLKRPFGGEQIFR